MGPYDGGSVLLQRWNDQWCPCRHTRTHLAIVVQRNRTGKQEVESILNEGRAVFREIQSRCHHLDIYPAATRMGSLADLLLKSLPAHSCIDGKHCFHRFSATMKLHILSFAAAASALVLPEAEVMSQIAIESRPAPDVGLHSLPGKAHELLNDLEVTVSNVLDSTSTILDQAIDYAKEAGEAVQEKCHETAFDAQSWIESATTGIGDFGKHRGHHGHHGHHHKPNLTVYELIAKSKYTTKLAALINEYEDLVELLNGTSANFTVFAPTDHAFDKVPDHAPKPSKEDLKKILTYHVSAEFFPAGRVLVSHTVPTLLAGEGIGGEPQRLSTNIGLKGLTVNFYSRIIAIDIFGTNGVIHGVDSILVPPPKAATAISLLPGEFSTLDLGLEKTGLFETINDTSTHVGGTLFAPSNWAFQKLGPKINAFLFSKYGQKYLKALLAYHVVANQTLYSDAYYKADDSHEAKGIPKGYFHVRLAFHLTYTSYTYLYICSG